MDAGQHRAVVLGRGDADLLGEAFVVAQAIAVGALAELQYIGLREAAARWRLRTSLRATVAQRVPDDRLARCNPDRGLLRHDENPGDFA